MTGKRVEEVVDEANPTVSQKILGDAEPETSTESSPGEHLQCIHELNLLVRSRNEDMSGLIVIPLLFKYI